MIKRKKAAKKDSIFSTPFTNGENINKKAADHYSHILSRTVLLKEERSPRIIRKSLIVICIFILGAIVSAAIIPLNETAIAQGSISPSSSVQPVQHLKGGIIEEILVSNGQFVKKGDVILRMMPAMPLSELNRFKAKYAALDMQIIRLKSFTQRSDLDYGKYEKNYSEFAQDQKDILAQQNNSREAQIYILEQQIHEQRNELTILKKQTKNYEISVFYTRQQLEIREKLKRKGLKSALHLLEAKQEHNKAFESLQETEARMANARTLIRKAEGSLIQLDTKLSDEAFKQIGVLSKELIQVMEEVKILEDKLISLDITAPSDGYIKGLTYYSAGAMIPPSGIVAVVVPTGGTLIATVHISPRDISHVKLGSEVILKIDTYNYNRYGGIKGKLHRVSASSFLNEKGETYFKGIIKIPTNYLGSNPKNNRLAPGMTVVADIKTGEETLLQYLAKPINNALNGSFRER